MEAVKRGSSVVCIQGKDVIVLGIERRAAAKLQDPRTSRKIVKVGMCGCARACGNSALYPIIRS